MSYPIETSSSTAATLYAVIHHPDGTVWNNTLEQWETFNAGHWADYAIPLTEQGASCYYRADYPIADPGVLTTECIYAQAGGTPAISDGPPMGIAQSQGVDLAAVVGDVTAAPKLQSSLASMIRSTVAAGTLTTTQFTTDIINANANCYRGRAVLFATGALAGQGGVISEFLPATGMITVTGAFTEPPTAGDVFVIA